MVQNYQSFVPNIFFYQICRKFVDLFMKNMKGWSVKKLFYTYFAVLTCSEKKQKIIFLSSQPFCVQIFPKYFFLNFIIKNICCCLSKSLFNWSSPFFTSFSKPAGTSTEKSYQKCLPSLNDQLGPNICQKVKLTKCCVQIFNLKQFISSKNGG